MDEKKLGSFADIQIGYQARTGVATDVRGKYKLLQGKNVVSPFHVLFKGLMTFSPESNPDNYLIMPGDVLFQSRGSFHYAVHVPEVEDNVVASGSFYIIRAKTKTVLPSYLAWWLNQPNAKSYFEATAGGTRISFVSIKALSEILVKLPPLDIQKKIQKAMNLWQHEIELREKMIELKGQLVRGICSVAIEE